MSLISKHKKIFIILLITIIFFGSWLFDMGRAAQYKLEVVDMPAETVMGDTLSIKMRIIKHGKYTLTVIKEGYVLTVGTISEVNDEGEVTLTYSELYNAVITVKKADNTALTGATVSTMFGGSAKTFTEGENGVYTLTAIYGVLTAYVTANGYENSSAITLSKENASQEVTLVKTTYSGTIYVMDSSENGISGAIVTLTQGKNKVFATDNNDGSYSVSGLIGEYLITAEKEGYDITTETFTEEEGEVILIATIKVVTYIATVTITENGNALTGAIVTFTQGETHINATDNGDGTYTAEGLTGEYTVTAIKAGHTITGAQSVSEETKEIILTAEKDSEVIKDSGSAENNKGCMGNLSGTGAMLALMLVAVVFVINKRKSIQ